MKLPAAVAILNTVKHRASAGWRCESGNAAGPLHLTEFEAIAVAEKYEREAQTHSDVIGAAMRSLERKDAP